MQQKNQQNQNMELLPMPIKKGGLGMGHICKPSSRRLRQEDEEL
jgi:hypothetical protein